MCSIDKVNALENIKSSYSALAEALTGIAVTDRKDWAMSIGSLLQKVRGGGFLKQLCSELDEYRAKGKIKNDYLSTDQCLNCLQEILDCIDQDSPDEIRFNAMKQLFISIAQEDKSDRNEVLPYQLQKICRNLTSGELLLLDVAYNLLPDIASLESIHSSNVNAGIAFKNKWFEYVLQNSGFEYVELIVPHEELLIDKGLFVRGSTRNKESVCNFTTKKGRLTPLGICLCKFIKSEPAG